MFALIALVLVSAPTERRLYPESFAASTFLWTDWNKFQENYHPNYAGDDDPKTAWVEGAKGTGVGEKLKMKVTKMDGATRVRLTIRNGYQKSAPLFAANGRVQRATITLQPSGVKKQVTLTDTQGFQEVALEQPAGNLETIELAIDSVYAGKKYEDTCISDVDVYVTATTPENPAFEKTHFTGLQTWRQERLDASKLFAKGAKADVPLAASYSFSGSGWDGWQNTECDAMDVACSMKARADGLQKTAHSGHDAAIALASAAAANAFQDFTPVQIAVKDARATPASDNVFAPAVDDFENFEAEQVNLPNKLGYLRTSGFGTFAVTATATVRELAHGQAKPCQSQKAKTFGWAKMETVDGGPARVRALVVVECALTCSRDGLAPNGLVQLLVYDDAGNLELRATPEMAQAFDWQDGRIVKAQGATGIAKAEEAVANR